MVTRRTADSAQQLPVLNLAELELEMDSSQMPSSSRSVEDCSRTHLPHHHFNPIGMHKTAASEYLTKHKIMEFFENLTSAIVYEKPDDPKAFARDFIEKLQKAQAEQDATQLPTFMEDSNLESIFGMLDVAKTGYISREQYLKAMKSLGLTKFNESPSGGDFNKISLQTFLREGKTAIRRASSTFLGSD